MKYVILCMFVLMAVLSAVAYVITPAPDQGGRLTVTWASDDNPRRREQIASFNRLHPDYELRLNPVDGKDIDKVVAQSLAGVGPDVFDAYRDRLALLHEAGLLYDVTDQLAARGITLDNFWPAARPMIAINGRIYGVPFNAGSEAIWYHRDLFRAEGVPPPPETGWTWDEFVAAARKLTKRDDRGRVVRYGVMNIRFTDVLLTNGGRVLTSDGRRCVLDSPASVDACRKWADLVLKYHVMPSSADEAALSTNGGWNSGVLTLFKEKRVAMAAGGRWWLCLYRDFRDEQGRFALDLGVAEKPVLKVRRFAASGRVTFVNALSPHRDRAVEFLAYLSGDEHADQINQAADALPGVTRAATRPSYYYDPSDGRDGGSSAVWKSAMAHAVPGELSPYVTNHEVTDTIIRQTDLVIAGLKAPEEAMRQAAADINAAIARAVAREPELRKQFENGDPRPVFGNFPGDADDGVRP